MYFTLLLNLVLEFSNLLRAMCLRIIVLECTRPYCVYIQLYHDRYRYGGVHGRTVVHRELYLVLYLLTIYFFEKLERPNDSEMWEVSKTSIKSACVPS